MNESRPPDDPADEKQGGDEAPKPATGNPDTGSSDTGSSDTDTSDKGASTQPATPGAAGGGKTTKKKRGAKAADARNPAASATDNNADKATKSDPAKPATEKARPKQGGDRKPDTDGTNRTDNNPPDAGTARPRGRWLTVLVLLGLLVALAAAAGTGWLAWRYLELQQQVANIPGERSAALEPLARQRAVGELEQRLGDRLGQIEQRLEALGEQREAAIGRLENRLESRLGERLAALENAVRQLREADGRSAADWRMAEVEYLVSVAARRLAIARDIEGAIAALTAADQALAHLGDARVLALRQRIVDDIAALRAVEPADVEGIALRLQNLRQQIPTLMPATPEREAQAAAKQPDGGSGPTDANATPVESAWAAIRDWFGQFVVVRREPAATPPSRDPTDQRAAPPGDFAGDQLVLMLGDATQAALSHDAKAYDRALGRALRILEEHYAEAAPATARFREALQALRAQPVATQLPDLSSTLELTAELAARLGDSRNGSGGESSDPANRGEG